MIKRKLCPRCGGEGVMLYGDDFDDFGRHMNPEIECSRCHGTGIDEFTEGFEEMGVDDEA